MIERVKKARRMIISPLKRSVIVLALLCLLLLVVVRGEENTVSEALRNILKEDQQLKQTFETAVGTKAPSKPNTKTPAPTIKPTSNPTQQVTSKPTTQPVYAV